MRYVVLHKSEKRIRIKTPIINMSYRQADLLEYYLKSLSWVKDAVVDERTCNATITFNNSSDSNEDNLRNALALFDENNEEVKSLLPEETGRALNREYEEKLIIKIASHYILKILLPAPIRAIKAVIKSVPYALNALKTFYRSGLKVEILDGIAIGASVLRSDFETASSIMFLLESGGILEEWTRKKSVGDLARSMSLGINHVWVKTEEGDIKISIDKVNVGDMIVVRTSDVIPLDGIVASGEMTVNQASMTGEAEPVSKCAGGYVYAGNVVEEGECILKVTKGSGDGKYDKIVRMIEESEKSPTDFFLVHSSKISPVSKRNIIDDAVPKSFLIKDAAMAIPSSTSTLRPLLERIFIAFNAYGTLLITALTILSGVGNNIFET